MNTFIEVLYNENCEAWNVYRGTYKVIDEDTINLTHYYFSDNCDFEFEYKYGFEYGYSSYLEFLVIWKLGRNEYRLSYAKPSLFMDEVIGNNICYFGREFG
jgi:hypothetical protein